MGILEINSMISNYISLTKENNFFQQKRNEQNNFWLLSSIEQQLKANFFQNPKIKKALSEEIKNIENGKTTPFNAAKRVLKL
jgi:LAO/AO transport system kinase